MNVKKILLLNPPNLSADNLVRDAIYGCWCQGKRIGGTQTPPYPLILIATVLKDAGHNITIIDAPAQNISIEKLLTFVNQYDFILLLTSVMTFLEDEQVLFRIKERYPEIKTLIYGAEATFQPEFCLKFDGVDFIIKGEGEFAIRDFLNKYPDHGWKDCTGLGYKEDSGKIMINPDYPFIEDLDSLPFPDWSLLPSKKGYFNPIIKREPYVTDLTTRGCPFNCIFCMSPRFYGKKVRKRSAENVLEGFRKHIREGYKEIYIRDEMFTTFQERNRIIMNTIIKEKMDISWICSARIGSVNYEDLKLMKKSGCHTIKFGVESGSQKILDNVKKQITTKQIEQTFQWCHELGIRQHAHLIIGNPGENHDTIHETMKFIKKIDPTTITIGIVTPYPGTPLFDMVAEKYPEIKEGFVLNVAELHKKSFYTHTFCDLTADELSKYLIWMHRQFYLRPSYILKWLWRLRNWSDFKKVVRAGLQLIDFSIRGN